VEFNRASAGEGATRACNYVGFIDPTTRECVRIPQEKLPTEAKCLSLPTRSLDVSTANVDVGKDIATLIKLGSWIVDAESRFSTRRLRTVRACRAHRGEGDIPASALAIVMGEADGSACDRAAIGVIEARFAEFPCACARAESMDADISGITRRLTSKVATAVSVDVAILRATFLRLVRHRDAVIGDALRTIQVRLARSTFVPLQARLLENAALSFEEWLAITQVTCWDTRRVDRHLAAQVVVAFGRHAVANLTRISRCAAIIATRAIRIGFAAALGAIGVGVGVALRDAAQRS
jgi:hypothetical protein